MYVLESKFPFFNILSVLQLICAAASLIYSLATKLKNFSFFIEMCMHVQFAFLLLGTLFFLN